MGVEALVAGDERYNPAKYERLDRALEERHRVDAVAKPHHVVRERNIAEEIRNEESGKTADDGRAKREDWRRDAQGDESRDHEVLHRRDGHGLQCLDFFADAHVCNFCCHGATGTPCQNNRREERADFSKNEEPKPRSEVGAAADRIQHHRTLESHRKADEAHEQEANAHGFTARLEHLLGDTAKVDFTLVKWSDKRPVNRRKEQNEDFEDFLEQRKSGTTHHFEDVVGFALRLLGRSHLAEVLQMLLDFGRKMLENELVARLFGKFR